MYMGCGHCSKKQRSGWAPQIIYGPQEGRDRELWHSKDIAYLHVRGKSCLIKIPSFHFHAQPRNPGPCIQTKKGILATNILKSRILTLYELASKNHWNLKHKTQHWWKILINSPRCKKKLLWKRRGVHRN